MKTPEAPDPKETAAAQTGMNRDTAITQQQLNMIDQYTPTGSLTYSQNGNNSFVGADGKTVTTPRYSATQTLTPEQQKIFDQTQGAQFNLASLANNQSKFLNDYLGKPVDLSNDAVEGRLFELGSKRLDPKFAQQEDALRTRLLNQGVREGSAAYDAAINNFSQGKNDAYNNLLLTGRGQAVQEALTQRNQPINEISALLSGSQVTQPQFTNTPQTGVAGVDYTGLVNQKYQADLQQSQASMGGLFGLGSALIGALPFSDRRLKTDIKRVGTLDNGLAVYSYRLNGGPVQIGVMADEVEEVIPEAVVFDRKSGFYRVNYALATEA